MAYREYRNTLSSDEPKLVAVAIITFENIHYSIFQMCHEISGKYKCIAMKHKNTYVNAIE